MTTINRSRRARESAGLSLGQASRLTGMSMQQLHSIEERDAAYADADPAPLADVYGVNVEWLSGRSDLRDYARLKSLAGSDELPFRDRDMIAELFASMPRAEGRRR